MRGITIFVGLSVAACGARTGLGVPEATLDAGAPSDSTAFDVSRDDGAFDVDSTPAIDSTLDARDAALDADDSAVETPIDAPEDVLALDPPRPRAPSSTSRATTRRPTFSWVNSTGESSARVEVCADRSCASLIAAFEATGTSAKASSDLPSGIIYWRLRATRPGAIGAATSATWELVVPSRASPIDTSNGVLADFDEDGRADVAVVVEMSTGGIRLRIHFAAAIAAAFEDTLTTPPEFEATTFGAIAAGDVDGDGVGDVVAVDDALFVYTSLDKPGSSRRTVIDLGFLGSDPLVRAAPVGDVDGDGYADVAVLVEDHDDTHLNVHRGGVAGLDPSVAWHFAGPASRGYIDASGACDVNGDGYSDVVVGILDDDRLYLGSPSGLDLSGGIPLPRRPRVCAGDVDGDGYADFWDNAAPDLVLYHGSVSGLGSPTPFGVGTLPELSSGTDVDGDGFLDLIADSDDDGVVYLSGGVPIAGAPTARPDEVYPPGLGDHSAALGDIDGDGYAESAFTGGPLIFLFKGGVPGFGAPPWPPWMTIDESATGGLRVSAIASTR